MQDNGEWWVCACGQINVDSDSCLSCKAKKKDLINAEEEKSLEDSADNWADSVYEEALQLSNADEISSVEMAASKFKSLGDWKDSKQRAADSEARIKSLRGVASQKRRKKAAIAAIVAVLVIAVGVFAFNAISNKAAEEAYNSMPEVFFGLQIGDDKASLDSVLSGLPRSKPSNSTDPFIGYDIDLEDKHRVKIDNAFIGDTEGAVWIIYDKNKGAITTIYWIAEKDAPSGEAWVNQNKRQYKAASEILEARYRGSETWGESVSCGEFVWIGENIRKYETGQGQVLYLGYSNGGNLYLTPAH